MVKSPPVGTKSIHICEHIETYVLLGRIHHLNKESNQSTGQSNIPNLVCTSLLCLLRCSNVRCFFRYEKCRQQTSACLMCHVCNTVHASCAGQHNGSCMHRREIVRATVYRRKANASHAQSPLAIFFEIGRTATHSHIFCFVMVEILVLMV